MDNEQYGKLMYALGQVEAKMDHVSALIERLLEDLKGTLLDASMATYDPSKYSKGRRIEPLCRELGASSDE